MAFFLSLTPISLSSRWPYFSLYSLIRTKTSPIHIHLIISIMNYLIILSCLFAVCLTVSFGQTTGRTTGRQTVTATRPSGTTAHPSGSTPGNALSCVCSCCSGLRCTPIALQSFADSTCTTKACKDKCKVFEPKHCDHTFMGTNDAYCTVKF